MKAITLWTAVKRFKNEPGTPVNAYDWYRRMAQRDGIVRFGGIGVKAIKRNGIWVVNETDVKHAINSHRTRRTKIAEITRDLRQGIIRGKDGESIEIEGGHYQISGSFRLEVSDMARARHRSYGTWYCNSCNRPAVAKHDKPECHLCSDWNGCHRDCTLSEVLCKTCGHSLKI